MCCCVTRCITVNLLVAVYHIGRLGSRNGHPPNASPCSPASCSRMAGHFSQPSLYLLTPEFSLLLQPSLHTVTQQKQRHTLRFFFKDVKSLFLTVYHCTGLQQSQSAHTHLHINCTNTWCSVTNTVTILIRNTLTWHAPASYLVRTQCDQAGKF
jgi:hypothetical protein